MNFLLELSEHEIIDWRWRELKPFAIYLYSPWCGTCQYAEKMILIAMTMAPEVRLVKSNVNFLPTLIYEWKIESVPCLVLVEARFVKEKIYQMQSVQFLLGKMREWSI